MDPDYQFLIDFIEEDTCSWNSILGVILSKLVRSKRNDLVIKLLNTKLGEKLDPDDILGSAVQTNNIELVRYCFANNIGDPSYANNYHIANATSSGFVEIVKIFLENKQTVPTEKNNTQWHTENKNMDWSTRPCC